MATIPGNSDGTRSAPSPMVAVPGAWGLGDSSDPWNGYRDDDAQNGVQDKLAQWQPGRVASLGGQSKRCHHGARLGCVDGQSVNANTGVDRGAVPKTIICGAAGDAGLVEQAVSIREHQVVLSDEGQRRYIGRVRAARPSPRIFTGTQKAAVLCIYLLTMC